MSLRFIHAEIPGVVIVEPQVHRDDRGFFLETYHQRKCREGGLDVDFVQDNHSLSEGNILRGLHAQLAPAQGKLVRVVEGEILDVAVDIRRGSPTFARWASRPRPDCPSTPPTRPCSTRRRPAPRRPATSAPRLRWVTAR